MGLQAWWKGATPHGNIRDGKVNEALFEAKLGEAIQDRGPDEYRDAELFFSKTFFTAGLRGLLLDILGTLSGRRAANAIVNLKTSFGGGKTHTELAVFHLFANPERSMQVPQVRELVEEAGLQMPPACRVAVLPGTNLSPAGRTTDDGLRLRTLWGEMAYRLGGPETFAMLADEDARLVSPGEDKLRQVLESVGPSLILLDETLHYVDKASDIINETGDLAKQTVAFLRELTGVVDSLGNSMMIVSLTASRMDQLSPRAQDWLERMEHHVNRLSHPCTPIEGTEIHEVVRRRLFDAVDEKHATAAAAAYHQLYTGLGGLPGQYVDAAYRDLIRRSYPFHPELITVIYERWGAKPTFQLTRGTLRFLALVLQDLYLRREEVMPDLIQMGHVSVSNSSIRAMVRDIAGDPQWESVIGSDIAAPTVSEKVAPAKAEQFDRERGDGLNLAEGLATTILLYSVGGGENPEAARHEIRIACARDGVNEATWDDLLDKFRRRFFYLYYDDAKFQFRKEPNVTSLHHTYRVNISESSDVDAHIKKLMLDQALGQNSVYSHSFASVYYLPQDRPDQDNQQLKLVVLGFEHPMVDGVPAEGTQQAAMEILQYHGKEYRKYRNTLVFCAPDLSGVNNTRDLVADFLSWRRIQQNPTDWDRIGGAQQSLVTQQMTDTGAAALKAVLSAYSHALVPIQHEATSRLALRPVPLGRYSPGKVIAGLVWDALTSKDNPSQALLKDMTPQVFLERYGASAWPESEKWVSTSRLWERFTTQVGLPMLTHDSVLLNTIRQGVYEGLMATGQLYAEQNPPNQRDSYPQLHFKETLPPTIPLIGERWLVMRPATHREIAEQPEQVTVGDILSAYEELGAGDPPIKPTILYRHVKSRHKHGIDEPSYRVALETAVKELRIPYRVSGQFLTEIAVDSPEGLEGEFVKVVSPPPAPQLGRTIVIRGTIDPIKELAPFFNKVVKFLGSQNPASLTMELVLSAHYREDPGGGFDSTLDEALDENTFPGLRKEDSRG